MSSNIKEEEEEKRIEKENQIKDIDGKRIEKENQNQIKYTYEEDLEKCNYKPVEPNPPSPLEVSVN